MFIAEHDEGFAPKVASIRAHNPAERVARWEAQWPPEVPFDDEEEEIGDDEYDGDEDI